MKRVTALLLAALLALLTGGCAQPQPKPEPDVDQVRRNHQKASQDMQREEDKQDDEEEE